MVTIGAAVVLALFVVPAPWGLVLVAGAISWEVVEKAFWFHRTKRYPVAVGPEAMIGQPGVVVADCSPDGKVRLSGERWNARCSGGARVGDPVTVLAVDRLTLIVAAPARSLAYPTSRADAPLTLAIAWPARGIAEQMHHLDSASIIAAAAASTVLWEDNRPIRAGSAGPIAQMGSVTQVVDDENGVSA